MLDSVVTLACQVSRSDTQTAIIQQEMQKVESTTTLPTDKSADFAASGWTRQMSEEQLGCTGSGSPWH